MKNIFFTLLTVYLFLHITPLKGDVIHTPLSGARLQGKIKISLTIPQDESSTEIQPGSMVRLSATIKNVGDKTSSAGKAFVRFAFQKPLNGHSRSIIFETEKEILPSIPSGKEITIVFQKAHQWPSLFDYIRDDWNMRQYEIITNINDKIEVIGRAAISVSAHYYEGPTFEIPTEVDSLEK